MLVVGSASLSVPASLPPHHHHCTAQHTAILLRPRVITALKQLLQGLQERGQTQLRQGVRMRLRLTAGCTHLDGLTVERPKGRSILPRIIIFANARPVFPVLN